MLHNSLAVTKSGASLGRVKQTFFTHRDYRNKRGNYTVNSAGSNKISATQNKETCRWIERFRDTDQDVPTGTYKIIHARNRECDIFEFVHEVDG